MLKAKKFSLSGPISANPFGQSSFNIHYQNRTKNPHLFSEMGFKFIWQPYPTLYG